MKIYNKEVTGNTWTFIDLPHGSYVKMNGYSWFSLPSLIAVSDETCERLQQIMRLETFIHGGILTIEEERLH